MEHIILKSKYFLQIVLLTSLLLTAPQKDPGRIKPAKNHAAILPRTRDISRASGAAPKLRQRPLQKKLPQKREGLILPVPPKCHWTGSVVNYFCWGDVNRDSLVDILEIVMMVSLITAEYALTEEQLPIGDLDDDALIDVADIVIAVDQIHKC